MYGIGPDEDEIELVKSKEITVSVVCSMITILFLFFLLITYPKIIVSAEFSINKKISAL